MYRTYERTRIGIDEPRKRPGPIKEKSGSYDW
jgi:hypothetical protein